MDYHAKVNFRVKRTGTGCAILLPHERGSCPVQVGTWYLHCPSVLGLSWKMEWKHLEMKKKMKSSASSNIHGGSKPQQEKWLWSVNFYMLIGVQFLKLGGGAKNNQSHARRSSICFLEALSCSFHRRLKDSNSNLPLTARTSSLAV